MSSSEPTLPPADHQAIYLYAVAREALDPVDEPGIEDRPVYRLQCESFAAAVSVVERADWEGDAGAENLESLSWVAPRAYRHEEVVEQVMENGGPVYPARFGTLFSTQECLREALDTHRDALRSYFDAIAGTEEWAVKGLLDRQDAKTHLAEESPSVGESGTAYLQRRKQVQDAEAELDDWLDKTAEGLLDPLSETASDMRVLPVRGNAGREAEVVFNWAFLVPRSNVDVFRAEVERGRGHHEEAGLTLDLTGPWPPYNFRPSLGMDAEDE